MVEKNPILYAYSFTHTDKDRQMNAGQKHSIPPYSLGDNNICIAIYIMPTVRLFNMVKCI